MKKLTQKQELEKLRREYMELTIAPFTDRDTARDQEHRKGFLKKRIDEILSSLRIERGSPPITFNI